MALRDQLFAVIGLSMAMTPLLVIAASRWLPKRETKRTEPREPNLVDDGSPRVIVAGIGRMGQIVARLLSAQKIPFTALDRQVITEIETLFREHIEAGGLLLLTSHHEVRLPGDAIQRIHLGQ